MLGWKPLTHLPCELTVAVIRGDGPVLRYDTKLWMGDLMEGAAYLPK
jgi:hypothetical protein